MGKFDSVYNDIFGDSVTRMGISPIKSVFGISAKTAKTPVGTLNVVNYMAPDLSFRNSLRAGLKRFDPAGNILPRFATRDARTKSQAKGYPGEDRGERWRGNVVAQNLAANLPGGKLTDAIYRDLDALAGKAGTSCSGARGCSDVCLVESGSGGATTGPTWGRLSKHAHFVYDPEAFVDVARADVGRACASAKKTRIIEGSYKGQTVKAYAGPQQVKNEADQRKLLASAFKRQLGVKVKPDQITNVRVLPERIKTVAVRGNGTSDIAWETIKGKRSGRTLVESEGIDECNGLDVVYYDYTKLDPDTRQKNIKKLNEERAARKEGPVNYSLTYSYDPTSRSSVRAKKTTLSDIMKLDEDGRYNAWSKARRALDLGKQKDPMGARSWTVAFAAEDAETAKKLLKPGSRWSLFPDVPVVDGDEHDLRFGVDPSVVVLKPKFDMIDLVKVDSRTGKQFPKDRRGAAIVPKDAAPYVDIQGPYNIRMAIDSGAPSFFQRVATSKADKRKHANGRIITKTEARKMDPYNPIGYTGSSTAAQRYETKYKRLDRSFVEAAPDVKAKRSKKKA